MHTRTKRSFTGLIFTILFFFVCGYLLYQVIICLETINTKNQELKNVQAQLSDQLAVNEELQREKESGTDLIIERAARDELGYAKPNERVFVDVSGK